MAVIIPDSQLQRLAVLPPESTSLLVVIISGSELLKHREALMRLCAAALVEGGELIIASSLYEAFAAL